jgi:hypothetical protein
MKTPWRFAVLALIPLGCAVEANAPPGGGNLFPTGSSGSSAGGDGGTGSVIPSGGSSPGTSMAGTPAAAGTFPTAGTFGQPVGGTFGAGGGGTGAGGASGGAPGGGSGGAGTAGKSSGGTAGTASGGSGTAGTGGTPPAGPYCDGKAKEPLPYTSNLGFIPSGWQGDIPAISADNIQPDGCAQRSANAVGTCSAWRYTPNAVTPAWSGVTWSRVWDANFTHEPVCLEAGATKVTFQAKGAAGGEQITVSAAGAAEYPITLTNEWKEYEIPLTGVTYNSYAEGVVSGFFWKTGPGPTVTFFIDDIQFVK